MSRQIYGSMHYQNVMSVRWIKEDCFVMLTDGLGRGDVRNEKGIAIYLSVVCSESEDDGRRYKRL